jgi:outer membrane protein TolC
MPQTRKTKHRWSFGLTAPLLLTACATYQAATLPEKPDLKKEIPPLSIDVRQLPLPALRSHPFNPQDGLDMTEVATLAVINNPDLKAQRRKAEVARAQLFNARLLPDPQLSLTADHPTSGPPPLTNAYGVGLNYDLITLVTHGVDIDVAQAAAGQVDLNTLWQEWQVVQQARTLYVQVIEQARKLSLLRRAQTLYAQRYARSSKALRQGNLTVDVTGTDLTALLDADTKVSQMQRQLNKTYHDLNALLGLQPAMALDLSPLPEPQRLPNTTLQRALADLPRRRPDLLALQAGYRSQEAKVHRAVLSQFPSLSVGVNQGRDTGDVYSLGLGITLNLPVLNANRGEIAIQRATRAQLAQEYQSRLDQTRNQIDLLQTQQALLLKQRALLRAKLPVLEGMVKEARRAYEAGNIGSLIYLNMANTLLNQQLEIVDLEQSLWQARIALDTLLAWPDEVPTTTAQEAEL